MTTAALNVRHMPHAPKLLLRGDSATLAFDAAVRDLLGLVLPEPSRVSAGKHLSLLWLSPTGWLLLGLKRDFRRVSSLLRQRLAGRSGDAIDVSDEYDHIQIDGRATADFMAALSAVDLSPHVFTEGSVARILVAGVPLIAHRAQRKSSISLYVDRGYAHYLIGALNAQAREFD